MKRQYQMPLGALAQVLLWSNGELPSDAKVEQQMLQHIGLLRAKLRAIERQLWATAAVRKLECPVAEEERSNGDATTEQQGLPWEEP